MPHTPAASGRLWYNRRTFMLFGLIAMTDQQPPKIEFPCPDYPIKVLGDAGDELHSLVIDVMERHAPGFDQTRITINESSKGRFQSITVWITATGEAQLQAIHTDLRAHRITKMVM
jgi:putative lipoic acid-binding regulatory protein